MISVWTEENQSPIIVIGPLWNGEKAAIDEAEHKKKLHPEALVIVTSISPKASREAWIIKR